jgi:hypothetical protein
MFNRANHLTIDATTRLNKLSITEKVLGED